MIKRKLIIILSLLMVLSGHVVSEIEVRLSATNPADSGFTQFNITLSNAGERGVFIDYVLLEGPAEPKRVWSFDFLHLDVNESKTLRSMAKASGGEYSARVVYHSDRCWGDECLPENRNTVENSNAVRLDVKQTLRSEAYKFFLAYGYLLLIMFIIYFFTQPLEEYLAKSFLLLLAIVNLTTALLDFKFNLYGGSFFVFIMFSFIVVVISIWSERIPEKLEVPGGKAKEQYPGQIKSNYFTWSGLWFAFISLELFVPIFWGLIKASVSVFYMAALLVFFVFILYKKGIVDDRLFTIVTSFVFAFFILNQVTSPIFEPRVNVIEVEPVYYKWGGPGGVKDPVGSYYLVGKINLQVEPALLGFLPSFGERKIFNEAVLHLPNDYLIEDPGVEYPCGIGIKEQTSEGLILGVDTCSANNRFCLYQINYEKKIGREEMQLDIKRSPLQYTDIANRTWDCYNVIVSNRGDLDVRGLRHFGLGVDGVHTCFIDDKRVECSYDPLEKRYHVTADIGSGGKTTLAICVI